MTIYLLPSPKYERSLGYFIFSETLKFTAKAVHLEKGAIWMEISDQVQQDLDK
jgi:hypothetical protein